MDKLPPDNNKKSVAEPAKQDKADLPNLADYTKPIPAEALESLRLAMCRANNLSTDIGNCPSCKNPEACKNEVSDVVGFITDLHEKRGKKNLPNM